ncbi:peptidase S8/S53 domain-containing protein, partial [Thamnocephalis sphaerospora]
MSLGIDVYWSDSLVASMVQSLIENGIVVVASAGNSGTSGLFSTSAPGTAPDVITVGAAESSMLSTYYFTLNGFYEQIGYSSSKGGMATFQNMPIAFYDDQLTSWDGCTASKDDLAGKMVVVRRGACTYESKAINIAKAGGLVATIYNDVNGLPLASVGKNVTIPVLTISYRGMTRIAQVVNELSRRKFMFRGGISTVATATSSTERAMLIDDMHLPSESSSWGPSSSMQSIKPTVLADGVHVYSTYPRKLGSWATMLGTSMAAPHVAGICAAHLE